MGGWAAWSRVGCLEQGTSTETAAQCEVEERLVRVMGNGWALLPGER